MNLLPPKSSISYKELVQMYRVYFSLGNIPGEVDNKFALISLICHLTSVQKEKNPDVTCYQMLNKITKVAKKTYPDDIILPLSIICEDFLIGCNKFNTCGLKSNKDMVSKIILILDAWLPF